MKGKDLTPWLIQYGYARGAFPMTVNERASGGGRVEWFQPHRRALFPIEGIHVSRSLARSIRNGGWVVTFDSAFEQVMRNCLRPTGNWISEEFIRVYTQIHFDGWGHSCEVWRDGQLAGGVYGIALGSSFSAESMFHRETNASKVALWALVNECRRRGFSVFDAQIMNPHLASLGAFEISAAEYEQLLGKALREETNWGLQVSPEIFNLKS